MTIYIIIDPWAYTNKQYRLLTAYIKFWYLRLNVAYAIVYRTRPRPILIHLKAAYLSEGVTLVETLKKPERSREVAASGLACSRQPSVLLSADVPPPPPGWWGGCPSTLWRADKHISRSNRCWSISGHVVCPTDDRRARGASTSTGQRQTSFLIGSAMQSSRLKFCSIWHGRISRSPSGE